MTENGQRHLPTVHFAKVDVRFPVLSKQIVDRADARVGPEKLLRFFPQNISRLPG